MAKSFLLLLVSLTRAEPFFWGLCTSYFFVAKLTNLCQLFTFALHPSSFWSIAHCRGNCKMIRRHKRVQWIFLSQNLEIRLLMKLNQEGYCFFYTSCVQQLFTFLHATLYFLDIGNALARSFTYDASANSWCNLMLCPYCTFRWSGPLMVFIRFPLHCFLFVFSLGHPKQNER